MNAPTKFEAILQLSDLVGIVDGLSLEQLLEGMRSPGYPDRLGYYQFTHLGSIFFPCDPRPDEVFIKDIARGLSTQHRFNGQTLKRITVAEHSWHTSFHGPQKTALERLMHDSPEGLIGDIIRPLKAIPIFGAIYLKIEDRLMTTISDRYSLQYPFPPCVRLADEAAVNVEVRDNIGMPGLNFLSDNTVAESEAKLQYWSSELAEKMFLSRFYELAEERGIEPY